MSTSTSTHTATEERALKLLGSGLSNSVVASAVGVSESRISQLLADQDFRDKVAELRFASLQKHNDTDATYDSLEDKLLVHLKSALPLIATKPMELLRAISVINGAKRRGVSAPEQLTAQQTVINLVMPVALTQKFTTNINNQVIQAGAQTLETIQSSVLTARMRQPAPLLENSNAPATNPTTLKTPAGPDSSN